MIGKAFGWIWRQIATFWSTILAAGSIVGILAAEFYEPLKDQQKVYFFLCLNAIVWTLIEIKLRLDRERQDARQPTATLYKTMREARPMILSLLLREIKRRDAGHAVILGGRIRSIIELVRQLADELDEVGARSPTGCNLDVYMMRPTYVAALTLPGRISKEEQRQRNATIVAQMDASVAELKRMCDQEIFKVNRVSIDVCFYDELPFGYFYLIGDDDLVFGGFKWSAADLDLVGPASPCWRVTSKAVEFEAMREWLKNRVELYQAVAREQQVVRS